VCGRERGEKSVSVKRRKERNVCYTLQHTAAHGNTLQHTPAHCNTLQHTRKREERNVSVRKRRGGDVCRGIRTMVCLCTSLRERERDHKWQVIFHQRATNSRALLQKDDGVSVSESV